MSSVGMRMQSFQSFPELIGAFCNIIMAHQEACEKGILHRNISINNVMLWNKGSVECKGLLIDFDHAIFLEGMESTGNSIADDARADIREVEDMQNQPTATVLEGLSKDMECTGTLPFISNAILLHIEPHVGQHDLESIFYTLIYTFTVFKGPSLVCKQKNYDAISSIPVLKWFNPWALDHSFKDMAHLKIGHLADFEGSIIKNMDAFFEPSFPFLRTLFQKNFPTR